MRGGGGGTRLVSAVLVFAFASLLAPSLAALVSVALTTSEGWPAGLPVPPTGPRKQLEWIPL